MRMFTCCRYDTTCALQLVAELLEWEVSYVKTELAEGRVPDIKYLETLNVLHKMMRVEVCVSTRIMPPAPQRLIHYMRIMEPLEQTAKDMLIQVIKLELSRSDVKQA